MDWQPEATDELVEAIRRIERELPGWWWSVGSCGVTAHASISPTEEASDPTLHLIEPFAGHFDADLSRPSTAGQALNNCIDQAHAALKVHYEKAEAHEAG